MKVHEMMLLIGDSKVTRRAIALINSMPIERKIKSVSIDWKEMGEFPGELVLPKIHVEYED
jgi:hypothetical protein